MVGVVRVTTLARLVLLISLTGVAPARPVSSDANQLCGPQRCADAAVIVVAAHRGAAESIGFRESARFNGVVRPEQSAPAVLATSLRLGAVDPAGARVRRRRASGQSAVCSSAALRGPPLST